MQLAQRLQTLGSLVAASLLIALALVVPVLAAEDEKPSTYGGGSVQGYSADAQMQIGTIVQLDDKSKDAKKVVPAKQAELSKMYGVAVDRNKLSFTLSSENLQNETYVATSGTYDVLVSTQGGTVSPGDYITMSAIDGVGTKADSEQALVFGRAARGFDGKANSMGTLTLKDTDGKTNKTVALGIVPVAIDIKKNPNEKSTKTRAPEFLQRIGEAIAEKEVSAIRIYLSIAITGISIIAAIAILSSGVRNSLISIGRNPMSKKSIFRALLEIVLTSIIILIIGLFAVYLLLKL